MKAANLITSLLVFASVSSQAKSHLPVGPADFQNLAGTYVGVTSLMGEGGVSCSVKIAKSHGFAGVVDLVISQQDGIVITDTRQTPAVVQTKPQLAYSISQIRTELQKSSSGFGGFFLFATATSGMNPVFPATLRTYLTTKSDEVTSIEVNYSSGGVGTIGWGDPVHKSYHFSCHSLRKVVN